MRTISQAKANCYMRKFNNPLELAYFLHRVIDTSSNDDLIAILQAVYPESKIEYSANNVGIIAKNIKRRD